MQEALAQYGILWDNSNKDLLTLIQLNLKSSWRFLLWSSNYCRYIAENLVEILFYVLISQNHNNSTQVGNILWFYGQISNSTTDNRWFKVGNTLSIDNKSLPQKISHLNYFLLVSIYCKMFIAIVYVSVMFIKLIKYGKEDGSGLFYSKSAKLPKWFNSNVKSNELFPQYSSGIRKWMIN